MTFLSPFHRWCRASAILSRVPPPCSWVSRLPHRQPTKGSFGHGTHRRQPYRRGHHRRTCGRGGRAARPQALPRARARGRGSRVRLLCAEEGDHRRGDRGRRPGDPAAGGHHPGRAGGDRGRAQRRPRGRWHPGAVAPAEAPRRARHLPPHRPRQGCGRAGHGEPRQGRAGGCHRLCVLHARRHHGAPRPQRGGL